MKSRDLLPHLQHLVFLIPFPDENENALLENGCVAGVTLSGNDRISGQTTLKQNNPDQIIRVITSQ